MTTGVRTHDSQLENEDTEHMIFRCDRWFIQTQNIRDWINSDVNSY